MVEEKTEVNDTGAEENEPAEENQQQLPTIDPETGEVKDVEPEAEPEAKPEEEDGNWEKRYKDLQSHSDKTIADKEKELSSYKNLVSPFQKNIKETEDGSKVFDFSDTSPAAGAEGEAKGEKTPEEVAEPDDDLWITDPKQATKQQIAFERQEEGKKRTAAQTKQDALDQEKKFADDWNKSWGKTQALYPDMADTESDLRKKANAIMAANPGLASVPNCNEIVANLAARELGVSPKEVAEPDSGPSPKKEKDTSYIIGSGKGAKGSSGGKKLSEAEFAALGHEEQVEYMRKGYMEE